jgi:hypothetical protein
MEAARRRCRKVADSNSDNVLTALGSTGPANTSFNPRWLATFVPAGRSARWLFG